MPMVYTNVWFERLNDEGKKQLQSAIDEAYEAAIKAGAIGGKLLGAGGELDELQGGREIGGSFHNAPKIDVPDLSVPDDLERLALLEYRVVKPAVIRRGHDHLAEIGRAHV